MIYKNNSDQELTIPNNGVWKPGEEKDSTTEIENPNFTLVSQQTVTPPKEEDK